MGTQELFNTRSMSRSSNVTPKIRTAPFQKFDHPRLNAFMFYSHPDWVWQYGIKTDFGMDYPYGYNSYLRQTDFWNTVTTDNSSVEYVNFFRHVDVVGSRNLITTCQGWRAQKFSEEYNAGRDFDISNWHCVVLSIALPSSLFWHSFFLARVQTNLHWKLR